MVYFGVVVILVVVVVVTGVKQSQLLVLRLGLEFDNIQDLVNWEIMSRIIQF